MGVVAHEEGAEQLRIVRADGAPHARTLRKLGPPRPHLRHIREDAVLGQFVEQVKIAEDGCEHRVDQAEPFAGEERTCA